MTRKRLTLGQAGEEAAAEYLKKKGFRIVQRNFRCRLGELDIVAAEGSYLVFVEVRTMTGNARGWPQESVNKKKKAKLRKVADCYIQFKKVGDIPLRFDVIAVTMDRSEKITRLEHITNAF